MFDLFAVSYSYSVPSNSQMQFHNAGPIGLFIIIGLAVLVAAVFAVIGQWKVFKKAGRPGWAAIIPFYNWWVFFEISGKPGWWVFFWVLCFIPIVGWIPYFVLYILAMLELGHRFGRSPAFSVFGLILFPFVGLLILGLGEAQYQLPGDGAGIGQASMPPQSPA